MRCGLMKITVRGISFSFDGGGAGKTHPPQGPSLLSGPPFPSSPGGGGCGFGSSLKKGMFLNVPFCREAANAAKLLTSD